MEQRITRQRREGTDDDCGSLGTRHLHDIGRLELALIEELCIFVSGHQPQARKQGHDIDGKCNIERIAPTPVEKIVSRETGVEE